MGWFSCIRNEETGRRDGEMEREERWRDEREGGEGGDGGRKEERWREKREGGEGGEGGEGRIDKIKMTFLDNFSCENRNVSGKLFLRLEQLLS